MFDVKAYQAELTKCQRDVVVALVKLARLLPSDVSNAGNKQIPLGIKKLNFKGVTGIDIKSVNEVYLQGEIDKVAHLEL